MEIIPKRRSKSGLFSFFGDGGGKLFEDSTCCFLDLDDVFPHLKHTNSRVNKSSLPSGEPQNLHTEISKIAISNHHRKLVKIYEQCIQEQHNGIQVEMF